MELPRTPSMRLDGRRALVCQRRRAGNRPERTAERRRLGVLLPDGLVDLLAVDGDARRGIDAQANLVATDVDDDDFHVVSDHDGFFTVAREDEHGGAFRGWHAWRPIRRLPCS